MTEAEAARVLGPTVAGVDGTQACHFLTLSPGPTKVLYMVQNGQVGRITLRGEGSGETEQGIGVGDTEAKVRAAYDGRIQSFPHKYVSGGKDLFVWDSPGRQGLRFEVDAQGRVNQIHGGDGSIELVEGCS